VEEIIEKDKTNCIWRGWSQKSVRLRGIPEPRIRRYLALAANNFAKDREAMEEARDALNDALGIRLLDGDLLRNICRARDLMVDRLATHDKDAAETED
jgi:hypothetical protein